MSDPNWQTLSQRIDRLERAGKLWKRVASLMLVGLGIIVLLGAKGGKTVKSPVELRGHRIVLVDQTEQRRAELTMLPDNQPGLTLTDDRGKPRLLLALSKYGEPMLSFTDAGGTRRIVLSLDLYGSVLRITDASGNPRAALVVPSEGEPELELLGKEDKLLWRAP